MSKQQCEAAGRTVVVTGAARGLGLRIARHFLDTGHRVLLVDLLEGELNDALKSLPENLTSHAAVFTADISDQGHVRDAFAYASRRLGAPTILVNNAGISPKSHGRKRMLVDIDLDEWRKVLDINLTGAFLCCRAALPHMISVGWGRIVNVASQAGRTYTDVAGTHYAASKAGMLGLTRTLAREVGPQGVTVNAVCPGRIESPMVAEAGEAHRAEYLARIPVGRLGTSEDVAGAVAYLASDPAGFITGHALDINGGVFMA